MPTDATLQVKAREELQRRLASERSRYWTPNGGIEKFLRVIAVKIPAGSRGTKVVVLEAGNGVGKTVLAVNIANYLTNRTPNPWLDAVPYLKEFRRPNRGRILTTATAAETAYDEEFLKWLPAAKYRATSGGRDFKEHYKMLGDGSEFDIMTTDQHLIQLESVTLDWGIIDEPCSRRQFAAMKSRFRFGGLIIIILTPLEGAAWMQSQLLTQERLGRDVFHLRLSSEENCIEHGVRGLMPHEALEDMWRDFEEDELDARRDGLPMALAGSIYKTFEDHEQGHVRAQLPSYYQECWDKGLVTLWQVIDPHDRKPWAIEWRAAFPDGVSFAVAEWPDESMRPFHKIKSWAWGYDQYAQLTVETEKAWGLQAYATIMDPNYGPKQVLDREGATSIAAEFVAALGRLKRRRRMIFPSDAITPGHLRVKGALGQPSKGISAKLLWLEHCKNGRFGMVHYGYKENRDESKGLSEVPVLQFKDFPDLDRYYMAAGARYINLTEELPQDVVFYEPTKRGNGYRGA